MKRGGLTLWLVVAAAAGLSIPPLTLAVDEVTGHPVPELNPLFIGAVLLVWLLVVRIAVAIWPR